MCNKVHRCLGETNKVHDKTTKFSNTIFVYQQYIYVLPLWTIIVDITATLQTVLTQEAFQS